MSDAVEAMWQDMEQEATDELVRRERHDALPLRTLPTVVFVAEGDAGIVVGDQTLIGDRDPVGVTREIGEHSLGAAERRLGIDHPCDRESSGEENEHEVLKPFIAIQRVQLPPGKGQPTSRKRALHGVRRRPS